MSSFRKETPFRSFCFFHRPVWDSFSVCLISAQLITFSHDFAGLNKTIIISLVIFFQLSRSSTSIWGVYKIRMARAAISTTTALTTVYGLHTIVPKHPPGYSVAGECLCLLTRDRFYSSNCSQTATMGEVGQSSPSSSELTLPVLNLRLLLLT